MVPFHGFSPIALRHGQGAELPQHHAFASKIANLSFYLQTLLILLTGFSEFALIAQHSPRALHGAFHERSFT